MKAWHNMFLGCGKDLRIVWHKILAGQGTSQGIPRDGAKCWKINGEEMPRQSQQVFAVLLFWAQIWHSMTKEQGVAEGNPLFCMAPRVGLEPTTCGLTVRRSTD